MVFFESRATSDLKVSMAIDAEWEAVNEPLARQRTTCWAEASLAANIIKPPTANAPKFLKFQITDNSLMDDGDHCGEFRCKPNRLDFIAWQCTGFVFRKNPATIGTLDQCRIELFSDEYQTSATHRRLDKLEMFGRVQKAAKPMYRNPSAAILIKQETLHPQNLVTVLKYQRAQPNGKIRPGLRTGNAQNDAPDGMAGRRSRNSRLQIGEPLGDIPTGRILQLGT